MSLKNKPKPSKASVSSDILNKDYGIDNLHINNNTQQQ
jgi:hypothetical protein